MSTTTATASEPVLKNLDDLSGGIVGPVYSGWSATITRPAVGRAPRAHRLASIWTRALNSRYWRYSGHFARLTMNGPVVTDPQQT
jgi:hypothetical protein